MVYMVSSLVDQRLFELLGIQKLRSGQANTGQYQAGIGSHAYLPCSSAWKFLYCHPAPHVAVIAIIGAFS